MSGTDARLAAIQACSAPGCDGPVRSIGLCSPHYYRVRKTGRMDIPSTVDLFWSKVDRSGECWVWTSPLNPDGYGHFWDGESGKMKRAHKYSYEIAVGLVPHGMVLDHLCRNRACVNPDHLQVVTIRTNTLRGEGVTARNVVKSHCNNGHPLSGPNLFVEHKADGREWRRCRTCRNEASRRYRGRRSSNGAD